MANKRKCRAHSLSHLCPHPNPCPVPCPCPCCLHVPCTCCAFDHPFQLSPFSCDGCIGNNRHDTAMGLYRWWWGANAIQGVVWLHLQGASKWHEPILLQHMPTVEFIATPPPNPSNRAAMKVHYLSVNADQSQPEAFSASDYQPTSTNATLDGSQCQTTPTSARQWH